MTVILILCALAASYCIGYSLSNAVSKYLGKHDPTLYFKDYGFYNSEGKLTRLDDHEVGVSK